MLNKHGSFGCAQVKGNDTCILTLILTRVFSVDNVVYHLPGDFHSTPDDLLNAGKIFTLLNYGDF